MTTAVQADPTTHPQYGTAKRIRKGPKKDASIKPIDQRFALRVKVKSLAAEAAIIRKEERRTRSLAQFLALRLHRLEIRRIARNTQLALAYIRGKFYHEVESKGSKPFEFGDLKVIASMVQRYGGGAAKVDESNIEDWIRTGRIPAKLTA